MSYFCDPSKSAHLSYELFRNLVQSKKLVPLISSALLAETIPVINAKNDVTKIRNLSFLEEFYTPDSWVKEYEDLLRDSIMAFATGRRRPVPLVRFEIRIREEVVNILFVACTKIIDTNHLVMLNEDIA